MNEDIIHDLLQHEIFPYGSTELQHFELNMVKYFEREYARWDGNDKHPETYGVSSFNGALATHENHSETIKHYEDPIEIYKSFLDTKYLAYTMAYYGASNSSPPNHHLSLQDAQINKFELIIQRADIKDNQRILDLGCGFGGFSFYLLSKYPNIQITGINPSRVQIEHISKQVSNNKTYTGRFSVIDKFISEITEFDIPMNHYDRAISIGLVESINNLDKFFEMIAELLKPKGKCLNHYIVSLDTIPQLLNSNTTLISEYYPGGHIWPYKEGLRHCKHLQLQQSWFINGLNYWKTLDEWHKRFWESIDLHYEKYLTIDSIHKWNTYFSLCKAMFYPYQGSKYGNGHYLYVKR